MTFTRCTLKEELKLGEREVTFKKANGEIRKMRCTLNEDYLPPVDPNAPVKAKKADNESVLAVYDLDKLAWRSFRISSVLSVTVLPS